MNDKEIALNVSHLQPCEPLERVLDALTLITPGQYLRVFHSREPFPLYDILHKRGFEHRTINGTTTPFEIFIWQAGDDAAHALIGSLAGT